MKSWIKIASNFIKKIGKQNFFIIVFILIILCITGLYQTFSLYTSSEGVSIVNGIKTYKFILANNEENSVTIAAGSSKYLAITVTNPEKLDLKYTVYYSSSNSLKGVNLGYLESSEYPGSGVIGANQDYVVNCKVINMSDSDITINFGLKYGFETGGTIILDSDQIELKQYKIAYLSEAKPGSYVSYVGRNGCNFASGSCGGLNANYSSGNLGYCDSNYAISNSLSFKYQYNGWRVGYIADENPYLLSSGAIDCVATDEFGNSFSSPILSYEVTAGVPLHKSNINNVALKYCNSNYSYDGKCDNTTSWAFGANDFTKITGSTINTNSCYGVSESSACGYNNDLIDIGGMYWYDITGVGYMFYWDPNRRLNAITYTNDSLGVRPVLKLKNDIMIISGDGTAELPYRIATDATIIEDLSGNGNHGVKQNATLDRVNGTIITDGSTNYVDVGLTRHDFGSDITLITKVKFNSLDSTTNEQYIFGNWEAGGGGFLIYSGYLTFNIFVNGNYSHYISTVTPVVDTWYTLVGTYDGTNIKFYINGTEAALNTSVNNAISSVSGTTVVSSHSFYVGGNPEPGNTIGEGGDGINGVFDDILIFDRAITASEVASNYSGEVTLGNSDDLLLYYDFENRLTDSNIVKNETGGVTTYYTSLSDAVAAASTTTTTTITLLEDTTESVVVSTALKDTTINLNGNTLIGTFNNSNTSSNITLKNGTVTTSSTTFTIQNSGTMTISSGTFINENGNQNAYTVINNATLNVTGGIFTLTGSSDGSCIYNRTTLNVSNATVNSSAYGLANLSSMIISDTIVNANGSRCAMYNDASSGKTVKMYGGSINGSYAVGNNDGNYAFELYDVAMTGTTSGPIYKLTHKSNTSAVEIDVYYRTVDQCPTWTSDGGQDDLVGYTATSATDSNGQTYYYCTVEYSNHNSTTSMYNTHLYNDGIQVGAIEDGWYWNFNH